MRWRLWLCRFLNHKIWYTAHGAHCYDCGRRVR